MSVESYNVVSVNLTAEQLEDMLDRAAKRGAKQALRELGLQDDDAPSDIRELRSLLDTYRDTRKGVWSTVVKFLTVAVLTFIATSVWMELGNK
jgi:ABC-type transporter Mla subunit MlaD